MSLEQRYRVLNVTYYERENLVILFVEPLDLTFTPKPGIITPLRTEEAQAAAEFTKQIFQTLSEYMPIAERGKPTLKVPMTLEDYEKLGKPGILDELTLTLKKEEV